MLRTFDLVLIGIMTATATVTYTIKHRAELKLEEVHHLEAEIKLEKDTIDLLQADWALVIQPNRLEKLVGIYNDDLKLAPTLSTALVQPNELPMLRSQLPPPPDVATTKDGNGKPVASKGDATDDEIRKVIADVASKPAPKPVAKVLPKPAAASKSVAKAAPRAKTVEPEDEITTGSVGD